MYTKTMPTRTTIKKNTGYKGERIEEKIHRIVNNKEPITDGAPIIFTERKHGVQAQYNIRTDRFEIAIDAMDVVQKSYIATREENIKKYESKLQKDNDKINNKNTGGESSQGTENQ